MRTNTLLPLEARRTRQVVSNRATSSCLTIASVLVPLDFSPASFKALEYALPLTECFGGKVHLVHAFDFDYPPSMLAAMPIVVPEATLARNAKRHLKSIAKKFALLPQNVHVVQGRAYQAICQLAGKLGIQLIVTATRGQSGLERVFLGSTAERIVQHAPCPVLVVREQERHFVRANGDGTLGRTLRLKKILVPLDFSARSMAGLEFALRFAQASNAKLVLLNSVPMPSFAPYGEYGARGLPAFKYYAQEAAEKEMSQLSSMLRERGVEAETAIELGVPAHQICLYAHNHEVDLIITSTHGSTGLMHLLMGSTAEHVVRYADCPVLVVPHKKHRGTPL